MGTVALVIVVVAVVAAIAWGLLQLRKRRDGVNASAPTRPPKGGRRGLGGRKDPMATAVASHSQAMEPHDAAVEELRLRAQANRVAAAKHQREADALAPSATEEARQQARAHQEAAAQHQRTADELEQRTPPAF
jgi:hypothetical protein